MEWVSENKHLTHNLISTGILISAIIIFRWAIVRSINTLWVNNLQLKKRWVTHSRNILFIVVFTGIIVIWASELQAFAISLVAVAAAIVLATKEIIMCVTGGVLKATSKSFKVGDRIEVNGVRGDVSDHNMLTTTINEVGPGKLTHLRTGKKITLPNSIFLTYPVYNDMYSRKYTIHTFKVPFPRDIDVIKTREKLLNSAQRTCSSYLEEAQKNLKNLEVTADIDLPSLNPRVTISLPDEKQIEYIVRVPAPTKKPGKIEQLILEDFFSS